LCRGIAFTLSVAINVYNVSKQLLLLLLPIPLWAFMNMNSHSLHGAIQLLITNAINPRLCHGMAEHKLRLERIHAIV
jgi:hypothetical protein